MTRPEPIILSWSGGKDSALALARFRADPRVQITGLLTTVTAGYDRVSIHGVRRALLHAQAAALGMPVHEVTLQPESSNQAYDAALAQALSGIRERQPAVRRVAFGDIFLQDVRQYREERIAAQGFDGVFPLWGEPTDALAREVIECGIHARLVCVDTHALSAAFAGRAYDAALLADLPAFIDPCGENGEFHTFVSHGPGFSAPVPYDVGEVVMRGERFAYCDLLPPTPPEQESRKISSHKSDGPGAVDSSRAAASTPLTPCEAMQ